jgi:OOP family OmpA-OmpF porin
MEASMSRSGIFWLGLAPALGLWLALIHFEMGPFERNLSARASAVLHERLGPTAAAVAEGRDIRLEGLMFDRSSRDGAVAAIAALPGVRAVADAMTPPPPLSPFSWRAVWDGAVLTLSGGAPSPAGRTEILAAAARALPQARIVDAMTFASGAPTGFSSEAARLLPALARLQSGEALWSDGARKLSGQATEGVDYRVALDADGGSAIEWDVAPAQAKAKRDGEPDVATPSPEVAKAEPQAAPAPAVDCKVSLREQAHAATVLFEYGSAEMTRETESLLDGLAAAARKCPDAALQVSGHSDDIGSSARNLDLSWRRAETVAAFMLAAGVEAQHIKIEGLGESRPLAPNDNDENRARNRRIEIQVK